MNTDKVNREDLLEYWKKPNDGFNHPISYLKPSCWKRSLHLYDIIHKIILPIEKPRILELGSGIGRNLITLSFGGYNRLFGVELSKIAVDTMKTMFPFSKKFTIRIGEIERLIYILQTNVFDIVFTMATLEHLPPESEYVFKQIVRISKQYLISIEDEKSKSDRHFPRNYNKVFEPLGMKQVKRIKKINGLSSNFICRIFERR